MELQGVARPPLRLRHALILALALLCLAPAIATAAATHPLAAPAGTPVLVTEKNKPPAGFRLTADDVLRVAARNPVVIGELKRHPRLVAYEYTKGVGTWQVSWFTPPGKTAQKELIQVYVSDGTGQVTQAWTGFQVAWTMARGYPGAFGRRVNAVYVWLPMCALFFLPFLPLPWKRSRRPTLWHLDLLVLLGFSVSLAFFNHANLGMSVPLVYPCLLYLLVRLLLLAFGKGRPKTPLRPLVPTTWLAVGLVFLIGFRVGLNVTNSNVIDVGYAGVIGANKVLFGAKLYGGWPADNPAGDTYGPINYYAYTPFNIIFGWSGTWDNLPAAHAAAIAFDLLTMLALFLLGRQIRGPTLGTTLAYLWAAYPFSLFTLESNSNDGLVALMLVLTLLLIRRPAARGVAAAWAGLTKFAPLALGPLFLRGVGPPPTRRSVIRYGIAYGAALLAAMVYVIVTGDLGPFWHDTVAYQIGRSAPFSIWGLYLGYWSGMSILQHLVQGAAIALVVAIAFIPRKRGIVEVAALAAAAIIALQLAITYWFYLYITWFFPLAIVALAASHPLRERSVVQRKSAGAADGPGPIAARAAA